MKKRIFINFIMVLFLANIILVGVSFAKVENKIGNGAGAAIAIEESTGRVLFEKNAYTKMYVASTTKIMTAIVTLENGNMNDTVTISKRAALVGGSSIKLRYGEKVLLDDLMYGLMLRSGNDAAIAIAEHIGGSVEGFVAMMNKKVAELSLKNTHFKSPHGLDSPNHYSTAYDMAMLTRYAYKNPSFRRIVATKSIYRANRQMTNTNEILHVYPGADGVKTGFTSLAGRCLVSSAKNGDMRVIGVVLNCKDRNTRMAVTKSILNSMFENYTLTKLVEKSEVVRAIPVIKGLNSEVEIIAEELILLPLRNDEKEILEFKVEAPNFIEAPIERGKKVGEINIYNGSLKIASCNLITKEGCEKKDIMEFFYDILKHWSTN